MPELARQQYNNRYQEYTYPRQSQYSYGRSQTHVQPLQIKHKANQKKIQRNYFIHRVVSVAFVALLGFTVLPYGFNRVSKFMLNPTPYKEVKADFQQLLFPTSNYISNHWFLGKDLLKVQKLKNLRWQL